MLKKFHAKRLATALTLGFATAAVGFGVMTLTATPAEAARPCFCPHVYNPVTCSNGVTYSNGCFASCAGATGCVEGALW